MSVVDTNLADSVRLTYLDEVRYWLPLYFQGVTDERASPLETVGDLIHLHPRDLRQAVAVHLALSNEVREFTASLPQALRRPMTRSERPRQLSRVVSGGIDWAATTRARATGSPVEGGFVTRPARRLWDIEENRTLAWALHELRRQAKIAANRSREGSRTDWQKEIESVENGVDRALRMAWLKAVTPERPTAATMELLRAARTQFYRHKTRALAELLRRYADSPSIEEVTELLIQRWFEPSRDWSLFELVLLLRIERTLASLGTRRRLRLSSAKSAFSIVDLRPGTQLRLWYQNWPSSAADSVLLDAASHYSIQTAGSRPDIVIEVETPRRTVGILIEAKATRSGDYLGAGLLQLLGYLRDRPALFDRERSGWLVAPDGAPIVTRSPDGRHLWALTLSDIETAVRDEVARLIAG